MGGLNGQHTGQTVYNEPLESPYQNTPPHTSGGLKWSYSIENVHVLTGISMADTDDSQSFPEKYEYAIYFGADDHKLYRRHVEYDTSEKTFSVTTTGGWSYEIDDSTNRDGTLLSDATGMPVLTQVSGTNVVFITSSHGRVHCVKQSDGTLLWRPADLRINSSDTLTPPLMVTTPGSGASEEDPITYSVVVGLARWNYASGRLYGFIDADKSGSAVDPDWTNENLGRVASTPISHGVTPGGPPGAQTWIYVVSQDGAFYRLQASNGTTLATFYPTGSVTCETWPMLMGAQPDDQDGYKLLLITSAYDSNDHTFIYGADIAMDTRWTDLNTTDHRVEKQATKSVPSSQVYLGRSVANPCTDAGATPNAFYLTKYAGSGTGKPTVTRILDRWPSTPDALGYEVLRASSTSDELTSTPIYATKNGGSSSLYYITTNGKLYAIGPTTGGIAYGWPKNLNVTVPRQDLSMDNYGGVAFYTSSGDIRCYWGVY